MEKLLEIMLLLTCSVFCKHEDVHVFKKDCQQIEELYLNQSSVILNIPQHMRTQQTQICTFKYKFKGLKLLKVSMDNKHKENCTFDIELRTGVRDRPVTVISCHGSRDSHISWPWSVVYLSVNFIKSDIDSSNKFITFELYASNTSIEIPNTDKQYTTINIPSEQYDRCLDSSTKNYRILTSFQKSTVPVMHEICLSVVDSTEVCIRTETKMFNKSYSVCALKMNVQMSKSNLITLRCQDINHFWCLPWRLTGRLYFIWTLLESLNASHQDRNSLLYISIQSTLPSPTSGETIDASLNTGHPDKNGIQNKSSYTDTLHKIISPLAACLTVGIIACLVVCARYKGQYGFMRAASQQSINMSSSTVEESFDRSQTAFNVNTSDFVNSIPPYYYYVYQMNKSMFPFPKEPPPSYPEVTGQSYPEVTGQPYPEVTGQPYPEVIAGHTYPEEEPPPYDVALRMIAQESRTDTET